MSPRERRPFVVFGFGTTHEALDAEAVLKRAGFDVVAVPTPAVIGELCGISMRVAPEHAGPAQEALLLAGITPQAVARVEDV